MKLNLVECPVCHRSVEGSTGAGRCDPSVHVEKIRSVFGDLYIMDTKDGVSTKYPKGFYGIVLSAALANGFISVASVRPRREGEKELEYIG